MNMDSALIRKIINRMEAVRSKPYMYIRANREESNPIENWLMGFHAAFHLLGLPTDPAGVFQDVIIERGYDGKSTTSPYYEIERSATSEEEKIKELLSIEIELWRRALAKIEAEEGLK